MSRRFRPFEALRSLYGRVPGIRELRNLNPAVRELREISRALVKIGADQSKALQLQAEAYEEALLRNARYDGPRNLARFQRQVFSQFGQDGMLAEIFRRIGEGSRTFAEIGIGNGLENNTVYLLFQGWKGFWIDADHEGMGLVEKRFRPALDEGRLKVRESFVTAENVADTFRSLEIPVECDLLSLDVDRNTYWVWKALREYRPRVAVIEYNGHFPPEIDWKVEYRAEAFWRGTLYFGASLKALESLGADLGYRLVGCTLSGVDAFFIRADLCGDKFEGPFSAEKHYEPFRQFLERKRGHRRCVDDRFDE
ncbi:MAG: hypothetical protein ACRD16_13165 [Thermoanaerobaculia bacterium]